MVEVQDYISEATPCLEKVPFGGNLFPHLTHAGSASQLWLSSSLTQQLSSGPSMSAEEVVLL